MEKKWVIVVDDENFHEILRQGIKHKVLFNPNEWEDNFDERIPKESVEKVRTALKGAVIISSFRTPHTVKLFIRNLEGRAFVFKSWTFDEVVGIDVERREHLDAR